MKILILSDLHIERAPFDWPAKLNFDVPILAGDIMDNGSEVAAWVKSCAFMADRPVVQIAGNHEFYNKIIETESISMKAQAAKHSVHFLDCSEVIIDHIRFLECTLWTDFDLQIAVRDVAGGYYD